MHLKSSELNQTNETTLEEFLRPTRSCDFTKAIVTNKAREITETTKDAQEKALKIFYWVRDQIKFGISNIDVRASTTLKKGYGECGNKTTLHMALLRAVGIPSRMHSVLAKRDVLQGLIPNFVYKKMVPLVSHFWCECYLDGTWISCESMLDKPLYENLLKTEKIRKDQIPTIDWDGKTDLILLKPWIVVDRGFVTSYDEIYQWLLGHRKEEGLPPKLIEKLFGWVIYPWMGRFTEKVRKGTS